MHVDPVKFNELIEDADATFMRMKDDYMQNGQLKPGHDLKKVTLGY